jgi:hypothetical protein
MKLILLGIFTKSNNQMLVAIIEEVKPTRRTAVSNWGFFIPNQDILNLRGRTEKLAQFASETWSDFDDEGGIRFANQ